MAGVGSPQISRRMRAALEDLLAIAPPERKGPLQQQLDLLHAGAREEQAQVVDQDHALRGDMQGLG